MVLQVAWLGRQIGEELTEKEGPSGCRMLRGLMSVRVGPTSLWW